ncbi:hypothetical protein [Mycolicibacter sinensis]|uniref:Uncharacterized protein n=1 Tax=Mycolicibacter sinensis (strain JDM601) TaxID=875328 RepID=A0A1A3U422_MYCSD|nr:hypothetical protein [Mycolicibacter sinensis]OBK89601.1 hypothetical protein A5648_19080 [Mycolicibacter sinensis]
MVVTQGHQLFAAELTRLAGEICDPGLSSIAAGITAPLTIAVCGRRGVGRRSVAAALAAAGVRVADRPDAEADAVVYVVAEAVKPEDAAAVVRAARRAPLLVVLNKADLAGHCGVAGVAAATGARAEPLSALFALAALEERLDPGLWAALRRLAAEPADLSCAEHFVRCRHGVPRQLRERLCATLDLSGIGRVLELARRGGTVAQARTVLRRLSGVDGVLARLAALGAGVQHRRMSEAVARLEALAVGRDFAARIDEFLTRDATVAARMAAAVAVLPEHAVAGGPLLRARRWQAYRSAPMGITQRACAGDITRGSLRAWAATRGRS